jgi:CRP-like cAMP-binding protein
MVRSEFSGALDGSVSPSRAVVQISGEALVCHVSAFKRAASQSESLLSRLISHEQTVYAQAQQTAACMASHEVNSRLARWLLRARDLADSDSLPFTQEFLADMPGLRRTSVMAVAQALQRAGSIKYSRGMIQIADIERLREAACECYEAVKSHHAKLLGVAATGPSGDSLAEQT